LSRLGALGEGLVELSFDRGDDAASLGFGGDAGNICVMATRLGARTRIGGRIGEDALGEALLGFWQRSGVEVSHLVLDTEASTGIYLNETRGAEHRFRYYRRGSAGSRLRWSDLEGSFFNGLGVLVLTGITLAISESAAACAEAACAQAERLGVAVACVLNHRPALGADPDRLAALAGRCQLVLGSREEAAAIFGCAEPEEVRALLGSRVSEVVLSDGPRGAIAATGQQRRQQPAPIVTVANAAGAGDALAGAYLARRLAGAEASEALAVAVAASSLSVEQGGCAVSYPNAAAVAAAVERLPAAAVSRAQVSGRGR